LSDYALEEEKLRKLYDQARTQGNKKKKKEHKEKIAELNRLRKYAERESKRQRFCREGTHIGVQCWWNIAANIV